MNPVLPEAASVSFRINHPELAKLYRYWECKRGARAMPNRADLDPTEIAFCLGYVALAEVEQPFRVRYRLVGTRLVELYGSELTNKYVDQLYTPRYRDNVLKAYRWVVENRVPQYDEQIFNLIVAKLGYYRLMLPLSWRTDAAELVLVSIYPTDGRLKHAWQWRSRHDVRAMLGDEAARREWL